MTTGTEHAVAGDRGEELRLLSAVLAGDTRASHRFFCCYNTTIERSVRKVLGRGRAREEEVRDLCGEVWLSLLEDDKRPLRRFDPGRETRVSTWISLLARNKAIDRIRSARPGRVLSVEELVAEPTCARPLPSEQLEVEEERALAGRALAELKLRDRRFLEAWVADESSPEELARREGISVGTVYTRRFKIQAKLAKCARRLAGAKLERHRGEPGTGTGKQRRRWPRPEMVH